MRLITHNMLRSNVKGVESGFPLRIEADKVEVSEVDFSDDFVRGLLSGGRVDWGALRSGSEELRLEDLPAQVTEELLESENFLRLVHHALLEVHVIEGALVCPESGRKFPISEGIPNMLLNEDEL
jgi:multifunctional methyltransferase subunit TRM112